MDSGAMRAVLTLFSYVFTRIGIAEMVKNFQQKKHAQTETVDRYLQVRRRGGREEGREGGRRWEEAKGSVLFLKH